MLKKLPPTQYAAVGPLFAQLDFNLVIRSVIAGNTPAWVFADRPSAPGVALIWDQAGELILAGQNQDVMALAALRNLLHHHLLPEVRNRGIPELALFTAPAWQGMLPGLLEGLDARPAGRHNYRLSPTPAAAQAIATEAAAGSISTRPITAVLLNSSIGSEVRGWVDSFWHTPEDFLCTGFGHCVVDRPSGQIVSWCLTVFAAGDERELGLATVPAFRGRGLAALAAAACITQAAAESIRLHWHCWADNRPSAAIAEKLGFQRQRDYSATQIKTGAA